MYNCTFTYIHIHILSIQIDFHRFLPRHTALLSLHVLFNAQFKLISLTVSIIQVTIWRSEYKISTYHERTQFRVICSNMRKVEMIPMYWQPSTKTGGVIYVSCVSVPLFTVVYANW